MTIKRSKKEPKTFWETKEGKRIRNFGGWCIAYGVIAGLTAEGFSIYLAINLSRLTGNGIATLIYLIAVAIGALYCLFQGISIRGNKLPPHKMSNFTSIMIFMLIAEIVYVLTAAAVNSITKISLGVLNLIILSDCIKYKVGWHKPYAELYDKVTRIKENKKQQASTKSTTNTTHASEHKEEEHYDEDL